MKLTQTTHRRQDSGDRICRHKEPYLAGALGKGLGDGVGAGGELVELEHTHGAVPDDGLAVRQLLQPSVSYLICISLR